MDFPLSSDSTAARRSKFFSIRLARLTRSFPRFSGVSFLHEPSKALRAAATAISTSFSEASWTEVMTSSVAGLMTSKVRPSTPLTHSLLMNLCNKKHQCLPHHRSAGWMKKSSLQSNWLSVFTSSRRGQLGCETHDESIICVKCIVGYWFRHGSVC